MTRRPPQCGAFVVDRPRSRIVAPSVSALVEVSRHGPVAVIALRREAKLNALSTALERALADALDEIGPSRAVVITGGERAFSAGADLSELSDRSPEDVMAYYRDTGRVYERVAALELPTLSAISGYCLGGGLELALATDFRIADPSAVFGFPEVGLGILPSSGGTHAGDAAARRGPRQGAHPAARPPRRAGGARGRPRHRGGRLGARARPRAG